MKTSRKRWTDDELEQLRKMAGRYPCWYIAEQLGRTPGSVKLALARHGIEHGMTEISRLRNRLQKSKAVEIEGLGEFDSAAEASRRTGIPAGSISAAAQTGYRAYGHRVRYKGRRFKDRRERHRTQGTWCARGPDGTLHTARTREKLGEKIGMASSTISNAVRYKRRPNGFRIWYEPRKYLTRSSSCP